jgi:NADH-quinone oxidoreductase subunit G
MCTRCVRFCDEITETYELRMMNRGEHTELTTFPGVELDNAYSMCTADLCPVGALTGRDFRFQARVWFTGRTQTVCDQCSSGCSMHVDTLRNKVKRLSPRENHNVNQWWACDDGRLSFKRLDDGRVSEGREGINGSSQEITAADAYQRIGKTISEIAEEEATGSIGILVHPSWSTEDHFVTANLAQSLGNKAVVYVGGRTDSGTEDKLLIRADKNANRRGMNHVFNALNIATSPANAMAEHAQSGGLKMVLVLDGEHELSDDVLNALDQIPHVVAVASLNTALTDKASLVAPTRTLYERGGTFVNERGWIQRFRKACQGDASVLSPWKALGTIGQAAGFDIGYTRLSEVFGELGKKVPAYAGLTLDDLGAHGVAERDLEDP